MLKSCSPLEVARLAFDPGKVGQVLHVSREDNVLVGIVTVVFELEVSQDIIVLSVEIPLSHRA